MELGDDTFKLRAGIPGIVTKEITDRGVEIMFSGASVQGVWGTAKSVSANATGNDKTRRCPDHRPDRCQFAADPSVLAGYCSDPAALQAASDLPVRGMILGGLSPAFINPAGIPDAVSDCCRGWFWVEANGQRSLHVIKYQWKTRSDA